MSINLRKEAKGRPCQIQIYGVCNHDTATSVLCHLPSGKLGVKSDDRHAAIGCSACHAYVDGTGHNRELYLLQAVIRTQKLWIKEGKM